MSEKIVKELKIKVDEKNTAIAVKSGDCPVFATPMLVALAEETAAAIIKDIVKDKEGDPETTSVGTFISASHIAATPIGMTVRAVVILENQEDRKFEFSFEVFDEKELISKGTHTRFLVRKESFIKKTEAKNS